MRSKLNYFFLGGGSASCFNSDTVRSKLAHYFWREQLIAGFNSDTVRSKQSAGADVIIMFTEFQFRHGAIKTYKERTVQIIPIMFQFRHGAIKTRDRRAFMGSRGCFNSDTVRSKLGKSSIVREFYNRFNSDTVRSKLVRECSDRIADPSFNSDTVRSKLSLKWIASGHVMVSIPTRCDQNSPSVRIMREKKKGFNSDTVRSKRMHVLCMFPVMPCFNSDTVRSKLGKQRETTL